MKRSPTAVIAVVALFFSLSLAASASGATVFNGSFETGTLAGWQQHYSSGAGLWYVESAKEGAEEAWPPPPDGSFFARDTESSPDTPILYQDIYLEPGFSHVLSMYVYYFSEAPIVVPSPNTLASNGPSNQQLRVDVMSPSAPIESVSPGDILATVFANQNGDPEFMLPTRFTTDLTAFAGQTVRLRIANAVHNAPFYAAVDGVSIASAQLSLPSNTITKGKLTLNKKKGTGKLKITVPGPGVLNVVSKGKPKRIKPFKLSPTGPGTFTVPLNPTGSGRKTLDNRGKLKAQLQVTFTPTGGAASVQTYKVTLKKTLE
jgi:hypothetical protein